MSPERRAEVAQVRQVWSPADLAAEQDSAPAASSLDELGPAPAFGPRPDEVVVGVSPAFGTEIWVALERA